MAQQSHIKVAAEQGNEAGFEQYKEFILRLHSNKPDKVKFVTGRKDYALARYVKEFGPKIEALRKQQVTAQPQQQATTQLPGIDADKLAQIIALLQGDPQVSEAVQPQPQPSAQPQPDDDRITTPGMLSWFCYRAEEMGAQYMQVPVKLAEARAIRAKYEEDGINPFEDTLDWS